MILILISFFSKSFSNYVAQKTAELKHVGEERFSLPLAREIQKEGNNGHPIPAPDMKNVKRYFEALDAGRIT